MKSIAIVVLSLGILGGAWAGNAEEMYVKVRLTADLGHLSDDQKQMIPLLIEAARAMDDAFWIQAYGDREALLRDHPTSRMLSEGVETGLTAPQAS